MAEKRSNTFILGGGGSPNLGVRQGSQAPQEESPLTGGSPYRQFNNDPMRDEDGDDEVSPYSAQGVTGFGGTGSGFGEYADDSAQTTPDTQTENVQSPSPNLGQVMSPPDQDLQPSQEEDEEVEMKKNLMNDVMSIRFTFNDYFVLGVCILQDTLEIIITTTSLGLLYLLVLPISILLGVLVFVIKLFKKESRMSRFIAQYVTVFLIDQSFGGLGILPITSIGMFAILITEKLTEKKQKEG